MKRLTIYCWYTNITMIVKTLLCASSMHSWHQHQQTTLELKFFLIFTAMIIWIFYHKNWMETLDTEQNLYRKPFKINKAKIFCPKFIYVWHWELFFRYFHHNRKFIQTNIVWDTGYSIILSFVYMYIAIYATKCRGIYAILLMSYIQIVLCASKTYTSI